MSNVRLNTGTIATWTFQNWCFIFYSCGSGDLAGENMINTGFFLKIGLFLISLFLSIKNSESELFDITLLRIEIRSSKLAAENKLNTGSLKTWSISYSFIHIIHPFICIC